MKGFCCLIFSVLLYSSAEAQNANDSVAKSPKPGWGDFQIVQEPVYPWWNGVLWYIPNRVLDLIDIFHVDVGVGNSIGAVVRVSRYVQVGYRGFSPQSHRIGLLGRKTPYIKEKSSEYGLSPYWTASKQRSVCSGEVGAGADLIFVGLYAGICINEVWDFLGGLITYDPERDDIR